VQFSAKICAEGPEEDYTAFRQTVGGVQAVIIDMPALSYRYLWIEGTSNLAQAELERGTPLMRSFPEV